MRGWWRDYVGAAGDRRAAFLLAGSAALVGVAIVSEGPVARVVNGAGAIGWLAAGVLLARSLRESQRWPAATVATGAAVIALANSVRPRDLGLAAITFLVAGAAVAAIAGERRVGWALLVPAAWLPAHLLVNIVRSTLAGSTRVRTEPPPTAALVPLAMVLAAAAGGFIAARLLDHRFGGHGRGAGRAAADHA